LVDGYCIPTGIVKFCVVMPVDCPVFCCIFTTAVKFQSCGVAGVVRSMLVLLDPFVKGLVESTRLTPAGYIVTMVWKRGVAA